MARTTDLVYFYLPDGTVWPAMATYDTAETHEHELYRTFRTLPSGWVEWTDPAGGVLTTYRCHYRSMALVNVAPDRITYRPDYDSEVLLIRAELPLH